MTKLKPNKYQNYLLIQLKSLLTSNTYLYLISDHTKNYSQNDKLQLS